MHNNYKLFSVSKSIFDTLQTLRDTQTKETAPTGVQGTLRSG